jgi:chaperonin GroES
MEETASPDTDDAGFSFRTENLAESLDEETLLELGSHCRSGFDLDKQSREDWERDLETWVALAKQLREPKNFPWPNASNVKYPLISTAAMQFAARAYPSLIPSDGRIVKGMVIGEDPTGQKWEQGDRVAQFMSWQIMYDMDNWEEDMDKLLMMLPVVGTLFKKTTFDLSENKICSKVILPQNLVVNYWAKNLETVERISEIILMSPRILKERQNAGLFLDIDLGTPQSPEDKEGSVNDDETTPYTLVEQSTFYDLDDDGYPEPYTITFERFKGTVLRIARRYKEEDVELQDDTEKVKKIVPEQCYTKYGFVPNPDGSFYDIGFGVLLGPINESVNTLINQLVDAGTLNNLQSGFIGKGLRMRMGESKFGLGEWKPVNATGDDLRKQIVPLPSKEPSKVLFELMGTLVTSGKELASVAEIFTGKMPGQNTPATTTMATVEQGMKVFTAVYKRIFRSLAQEFKKIYLLNSEYLDPNTYVNILDINVDPEDFNPETYNICPAADPTASSQQEKLQKAAGVLELVQMAPQAFNIVEVLSRVLQAQEQPNWQQLFSPEVQQSGQLPPPPPDPKVMAIQMKAQADAQKMQMDLQAKQQEMELDSRDRQMQMQMKEQEHAQKMQQTIESTQIKAASEMAMAKVYHAQASAKGNQELVQKDEAHTQKMSQQKEANKLAAQKQKSTQTKSGSSTRKPSNSKGK